MEEIIQAIIFEAKRHRAQAKLADLGDFHERQAELLERGAEIIARDRNGASSHGLAQLVNVSSFKGSINEPRRTEEWNEK